MGLAIRDGIQRVAEAIAVDQPMRDDAGAVRRRPDEIQPVGDKLVLQRGVRIVRGAGQARERHADEAQCAQQRRQRGPLAEIVGQPAVRLRRHVKHGLQPSLPDQIVADKTFAGTDQAIRRGDAAADHLEIVAELLDRGDLVRVDLDETAQESRFADGVVISAAAGLRFRDAGGDDVVHPLAVDVIPVVLREGADPVPVEMRGLVEKHGVMGRRRGRGRTGHRSLLMLTGMLLSGEHSGWLGQCWG